MKKTSRSSQAPLYSWPTQEETSWEPADHVMPVAAPQIVNRRKMVFHERKVKKITKKFQGAGLKLC